jgi:tetratricopeptide (TPR) repeat protein
MIEADDDEFEREMDDWIDQALKRGEGFKSEEEKLAYLDSLGDPLKHPLFSQDEEELKNHPLTEAFRLLREEDKSLVELATMYKNDGNEFMKKKPTKNHAKEVLKNMNEAYDRYSHAVTLIQQAKIARLKGEEDPKDASIDLNLFHAQVLANRAQASLNIKNYRYCISDCTNAIKYDPRNIKAYYRKSKALFSLKKYREASLTCQEGLSIEPTNQDLMEMRDSIQKQLQILEARQAEMVAAETAKRNRWGDVWRLVDSFGYRLGYPLNPSNPYSVLTQEYYPIKDNNNTITFPMLFLYPEYGEHDIVQAAGISDLLVEHAAMMFPEKDEGSPAPWDKKHEYYASSMVFYLPLDLCPRIESYDQWMDCYHELHAMQGKDLTQSSDNEETNEEEILEERRNKVQERYTARLASFEKNKSLTKSKVLEVHLGCSIQTLLQVDGNVLSAGVVTLLAFVRDNDAHKQYLRIQRSMGTIFLSLEASGILQSL